MTSGMTNQKKWPCLYINEIGCPVSWVNTMFTETAREGTVGLTGLLSSKDAAAEDRAVSSKVLGCSTDRLFMGNGA